MVPFTRVSFWVPIFDPHPLGRFRQVFATDCDLVTPKCFLHTLRSNGEAEAAERLNPWQSNGSRQFGGFLMHIKVPYSLPASKYIRFMSVLRKVPHWWGLQESLSYTSKLRQPIHEVFAVSRLPEGSRSRCASAVWDRSPHTNCSGPAQTSRRMGGKDAPFAPNTFHWTACVDPVT